MRQDDITLAISNARNADILWLKHIYPMCNTMKGKECEQMLQAVEYLIMVWSSALNRINGGDIDSVKTMLDEYSNYKMQILCSSYVAVAESKGIDVAQFKKEFDNTKDFNKCADLLNDMAKKIAGKGDADESLCSGEG